MLKRIKVRGKLLLLLATPLLAVVVFAASGIVDRTERTTFQEGEARIAELADAGADLSLAIQIERIRVLAVERIGVDNNEALAADRANTNAQLDRWIAAIDSARPELSDPQLVDELDDLATRLPSTLSPARGSDAVTGTLLAGASRAIDETTTALAGEANDLDLFRALTDLNQLLTIQSSYATIASIGSEAIFQDNLSAVAATLVAEAERTAQNSIVAFTETADRKYLTGLQRLQNSGVLPNATIGPVDSVGDIQDAIVDQAMTEWLQRAEAQLVGLNDLIGSLITDATIAAQQEATTANDEARSFLILAGCVVLIALLMAVLIGRSISRPLSRLTHTAEQLSAEELPALVESMRSTGRSEAPVLTPIEIKGRDEVAQLAQAISQIQQVTIDVAEEQGELLRRGISDIFVNLARRNQSLLDRQIDFIDQLESREENPDQLENLFRLDHLATRMRRNAESLLVLAGAEPTRRRGRPVEIIDVLRVAMGEIEDFSRIKLTSVDSSTVAGSVAVDLAHLTSELMENATQFSPPEVDVTAVGYRIADGSYQLTLADKGIGMSAEQILTANKTLSEPPLVGLDLSRSLGFTVISRLAHRLGVTVQLASGSEGGVTAVVTIPAEMVGEAEDRHAGPELDLDATIAHPTAPATRPAFAPPTEFVEAAPDQAEEVEKEIEKVEPPPTPAAPVFHEPTEPAPPIPAMESPPANPFTDAPLAVEPPAGHETPSPAAERADENGLAKLPTRQPKASQPAAPPAAGGDGDLFAPFGSPADVPQAPADPTEDIFASIDTGTPLPSRTPKTAPSAEAPSPPAEPAGQDAPAAGTPLPSRDPAAVGVVPRPVTSAGLARRTPKNASATREPTGAGGGSLAAPAAMAPANRSPEEVRQMLSRYRAGLRKGRAPEPGTDEPNRRS